MADINQTEEEVKAEKPVAAAPPAVDVPSSAETQPTQVETQPEVSQPEVPSLIAAPTETTIAEDLVRDAQDPVVTEEGFKDDKKEKFAQAKREVIAGQNANPSAGFMTPQETDEAALELLKAQKQELVNKHKAEGDLTVARVNKRRAYLAKMKAEGLEPSKDEELDSLISQQDSSDQEAKTAVQKQATESAELTAAKDEATKLKKLESKASEDKAVAKVQNDIQTENETMEAESKIDPNRFWKDKTMGDKIGFSLALALGGLASGINGGPNQILASLEKQIDRDIKAQQLDMDKSLALKSHGLKQAQLKLNELDLKGKNALRSTQIGEIRRKAQDKIDEVDKGRAVQRLLKEGKIKNLNTLSEKEQKRAIIMPDGSIRVGRSEPGVTKLNDYRGKLEPAVGLIDEILELSEGGAKFSGENRKVMATKIENLVGSLRESVLGPGTMQVAEYERILRTIGDPNSALSIPSFERAKLRAMKDKVYKDLNFRYRNEGVVNNPYRRGLARKKAVIDRFKARGQDPNSDEVQKMFDKLYKGK